MNLTRRTVVTTAVALLAMGSFTGGANAETLMDRAQGDGLRVAFYNFKPFSYEDGNGNLTGTDVETLRIVLQRMGGKIDTLSNTDWGALIPGLKANRFDVVAAGMYITPERCAEVQFSEPLFGMQQGFIVAAGNPKGLSNYESVAATGALLGVVPGTAQEGYASEAGVASDKIFGFPDNPTGIAALLAGRIDVWGISGPSAREIIANTPGGGLEAVPPFAEVAGQIRVSHGAFAFRPEDSEFVEAFNVELEKFTSSPEYVELLEAHGLTADELPLQDTATLCAG
ncbi:MAG: ectoine/hydroxyectoine ABC transporter substrate-binding protein EhuB [Paracoccaceae bacterium]